MLINFFGFKARHHRKRAKNVLFNTWDARKWNVHTVLTHCSLEVNAIHTGQTLVIQGLKISFKTGNLQNIHLDCSYLFFMDVLNNVGTFVLFVSNSIRDSTKPMLHIFSHLLITLASPTTYCSQNHLSKCRELKARR